MNQLIKKDVISSLICGIASGLFLIFIVKNPYIEEFRGINETIGNLVFLLPLILVFIFVVGLWIVKFISQKIAVLFQMAKFAQVGVLNTLIDFGIFNLLIWITGIISGTGIILLNTLSILVAIINSYFWNKYWTFSKKGGRIEREFLQFLVISIIGWALNTSIVFLGTTFIEVQLGVSAGAWVNIMKALAVVVSMTWNFLGYKFIVFKKQKEVELPIGNSTSKH